MMAAADTVGRKHPDSLKNEKTYQTYMRTKKKFVEIGAVLDS